jgi:hypothetical protein
MVAQIGEKLQVIHGLPVITATGFNYPFVLFASMNALNVYCGSTEAL